MKALVRIAVLLVLTLALVLTATAADSVVLDFSDIDEVNAWLFHPSMKTDENTGKLPQLTDPDGTVFMRAVTTDTNAPNYTRTFTDDARINLDEMPYFVMKSRRNYTDIHYIYARTDYHDSHVEEQYAWFSGMILNFDSRVMSDNDQWDVVVLNMADHVSSYTTQLKGEDKSSASPNPNGYQHYTGNLYSFMVQPSTHLPDIRADYEFMAFAADEKSAWQVVADFASKMMQKDFVLNRSGNFDTALRERAQQIAARYELTLKDAQITSTSDDAVEYSYTFTHGSYDFAYTGSADLASYDVRLEADSTEILLGDSVTLSAYADTVENVTSYKWYSNTVATEEGATALENDGQTLTEQLLQKGSVYYYVVVEGTLAGGQAFSGRSDYLRIDVNVPDEPIIFRFNNQEVVKRWSRYPNFDQKQYSRSPSTIVDGVMHTEFDTEPGASNVDDHDIFLNDLSFYLQAYPYIKYKYKFTGGARSMQMYLNKDSTNPVQYIEPSFDANNKDVWTTVSINAKQSSPFHGNLPYEGFVGHIRFWFWMTGEAGSSDIEYIAFFPDSDAGRKAWENFDSKNPTVTGSSDEYMPYYDELNAVLEEVENALDVPDSTISDKDKAQAKLESLLEQKLQNVNPDDYSVEYVGDASFGYEFKVTLAKGRIESRSMASRNIIVSWRYRDPIIWRFNSQEVLDMWDDGDNKVPTTIIDGVAHTEYDVSVLTDQHSYIIPEDKQFELQDYPYIKVKYKYSGYYRVTQLYIYTDKSTGNPYIDTWSNNTEVKPDTWITGWADYSGGNLLKPAVPYTGKVKKLMFWLWTDNKAGSSDIEYIAFFADKQQWRDFDSQSPFEQGSSDKYLAPEYPKFSEIVNALREELAEPYDVQDQQQAQQILEQAIDKVCAGERPDITVEFVEQVPNGFKFNLKLALGDAENRYFITEEIIVKNKYPDPVIWNMSSPDFIDKWQVSLGVVNFTYNREGYFNLSTKTPGDNCNMIYFIPEGEWVDLDDLPYISIKYRSTRSGNIQLYPITDMTVNLGATDQFYYEKRMPSTVNDWVTLTFKVLNESDAKNEKLGTWCGKLKHLRVDFMRPGAVMKGVDVEYIGFFATQQQAEEYDGQTAGDMDLVTDTAETLDTSAFETAYDGVYDMDSALQKAQELAQNLDLPEGVRTYLIPVGITPTDPSLADEMVGKFKFELYLINGPVYSSASTCIDLSMPLRPKAQLTMLEAQYRQDDKPGVRFGTKLFKSFLDDADVQDVSYGTVVIPSALIPDGQPLTLDTPNAADVPGVNIFEQNDEYVLYTAVVTDTPEEMQKYRVSARAYVKYTFGGEQYVQYSDTTKSCSEQEIKALANTDYDSAPDLSGQQTYQNDIWMHPFWTGDTVYYELFWPVMPEGSNGDEDLIISLMYPISEVLSLKNGTNTLDFVEGKDFYVNQEGKLVIPADSAIYRMPFDMYMTDTPDSVHDKLITNSEKYNGKYLYFTEAANIQTNFQYSVTYRHTATWPEDAFNPDQDYDPDTFPITRSKLENREPFTIALFGDSNTNGGNSTANTNTSPFTPQWGPMVVERLEALYGYTDTHITLINRGAGGTGSRWGVNGNDSSTAGKYAATIFANDNPTLFILGFGGNDEALTLDEYRANMIAIIEQIRGIYPECEFLLQSHGASNPIWQTTEHRDQHERILEGIVDEYRAKGVTIDCAKRVGMHKQMLEFKEYRDLAGNNVNHPNDTLSRLFAQTVIAYITDRNK